MSANAAKALFDSLGTEADLQELVDEKEPESLYLEYKGKQHPTVPEMSDVDKQGFSKSLSGFANADGGVLIWGILTKVTNTNVDYAETLKPINQVEAFHSRLSKSILNATQPVVDDVVLHIIPAGTIPQAGYVAVSIPASDKAPHRAILAAREYWRKTSEGFYRLEHFDLEDLFGRRPRPALEVSVAVSALPLLPKWNIDFFIRNTGRAIARFPAMKVDFESGVKIEATENLRDNSSINSGRPIVAWDDNLRVFHVTRTWGRIGSVRISGPKPGTRIKASVELFADRMKSLSIDLPIDLPAEP